MSSFVDEEQLIKKNVDNAMGSFQTYRKSLITSLTIYMDQMEQEFKKQLNSVAKRLSEKINGGYRSSIKSSFSLFDIASYVDDSYKAVTHAIKQLQDKMFRYVNDFSTEVIVRNIEKTDEVSLLHPRNTLFHNMDEWYSVTSRCLLRKATIKILQFKRTQTSWLALGVSTKMKEYYPVKNSLAQQSFMGSIYLNGNERINSPHQITRDLKEGNVYVIENINRLIYIYRQDEGRRSEDSIILKDNSSYYFYIALKGFLEIQFQGE